MRSLGKALLWFCWNAFFGLLPILLFYILRWFDVDHEITKMASEELIHLIEDIVLLFFCCAMIGGISLDVCYGKKKYSGTVKFLLGMITMLPIVIALIIYLPAFATHFAHLNYQRYEGIQWAVFGATFVYCSFTKTRLLLNEEKK